LGLSASEYSDARASKVAFKKFDSKFGQITDGLLCFMSVPQIELHTLGEAFGMRSVSPFCLKLEMLLAHLGLDYTLIVEADPRSAPKGKMPWAKINGAVFADSEIILAEIDRLTEGGVFDGLSEQDQAFGLGLVRLAEEHLYWLMAAARWLDDAWWPNVVRDFMKVIPWPLRPLGSAFIRRRMSQTIRLQGLGAHSLSEQLAFAHRDLKALEGAVGGDGFLFSDRLSVFDFSIAALMAGIYDNKPGTWLSEAAEGYVDLKAYVERVQQAVGVYGRK
jgi:glutathione S-transferase